MAAWMINHLLSVISFIGMISEVVCLNDQRHEHNLITKVFIGCFIVAIIVVVVFHCWLKRQPLHKEDMDTTYIYQWENDEKLDAMHVNASLDYSEVF